MTYVIIAGTVVAIFVGMQFGYKPVYDANEDILDTIQGIFKLFKFIIDIAYFI